MPRWGLSFVREGALYLSDTTLGNASSTKHGLLPKLSGNSAQFLDGTGVFSTPGGSGGTVAHCKVRRTTDQNLANSAGSTTAVQWPTEDVDTDTMHDTVTDNNKVVVKYAVPHMVGGSIQFAGSSGTPLIVQVWANGLSRFVCQSVVPAAAGADITCVPFMGYDPSPSVSDYYEVYAGGGSSNRTAQGTVATNFWVMARH
jgi:hypothetical protein